MKTVLGGALGVAMLWAVAGCSTDRPAAREPGAGPKGATLLPGGQRDGSVLLPNQWSLRPVGKQVAMGDFPINLAIHPSQTYAAVLHSGFGQHEVRILDVATGQTTATEKLKDTFYGLAWSPDGGTLFVSGGGGEVIHRFSFAGGKLSPQPDLVLRPPTEEGVPTGLAVSDDGGALYVAESWGQRVEKVEVAAGRTVWTRTLGIAEGKASNLPESARVKPASDPRAPFPYTCLPDEKHGRVYVSLWAKSAVLVLDAKTGADVAVWPVGEHPNEMVLAPDGRLFVAESNFNTVSAIDTATGRVTEVLSASLFPHDPPGSMPNSLALSDDGELLFVANANNNNVAVFDVDKIGRARSLGFIPVGWFPTSVRVTRDGGTLLVANGKGVIPMANPQGEYIGGLLRGTVSLIGLPTEKHRPDQMGVWTKAAYACSPLDGGTAPRGTRPQGNPLPGRLGDASPIKHVIYIIRENRSYDQVFGDLAGGNGRASLCLFPEKVTPNAHALARQFVILDNFYADGEVSADGHEWSMGAQATDFVEKMWPLNYGHNRGGKFDYPAEGHYPVAFPANGYLWNRAAEAGVSYRSYGEFCNRAARGPALAEPGLPILVGHIDPSYMPFDLSYPDAKRADQFVAELQRYEKEGGMPRLLVVRLPNDHTMGTRPGAWTPTAMVADNDLALGRMVDAVTHSKFWPDTAIFVLEDDAQSGPDHVDAHRIPALVISPWTRRGSRDSTLYSTTSMLRTMELILGLQPMSQFDAAALPMWDCFTGPVNLSPYGAVPAQVPLDSRNAKVAWGAAESGKMDFTEPDRADPVRLSEIIWRSVRGADSPMPAPVHAAFYQEHAGDDDDD